MKFTIFLQLVFFCLALTCPVTAQTDGAVPREGPTLDGRKLPSQDDGQDEALEAPTPPSPRETSRRYLEQRLARVSLPPAQKNELIRVFLNGFDPEAYINEPALSGQVDSLVSIASDRSLSQEEKVRRIKERLHA